MDAKLSVGTYENIPDKLGLIDGGQKYINCSNCEAPLCRIWVTQPNAKNKFKLRAKCCHCGDFSMTHEVNGWFSIGHGGTGEDDDFVMYTQFEAPSGPNEKGIYIIDTVKVRQWQG